MATLASQSSTEHGAIPVAGGRHTFDLGDNIVWRITYEAYP
jgi:hypothetical protein